MTFQSQERGLNFKRFGEVVVSQVFRNKYRGHKLGFEFGDLDWFVEKGEDRMVMTRGSHLQEVNSVNF